MAEAEGATPPEEPSLSPGSAAVESVLNDMIEAAGEPSPMKPGTLEQRFEAEAPAEPTEAEAPQYSDEHERSAAKIQAAARGRAARKKVAALRGAGDPSASPAAEEPQAAAAAEEEAAGPYSDHHARSATRIQAAARGRAARKRVAGMKGGEQSASATDAAAAAAAEPPAAADAAADAGGPYTDEHARSAAKIQAAARGRAARKRVAGMKSGEQSAPATDAAAAAAEPPAAAAAAADAGGPYTDEHARSAAKIQAAARGRAARKRVAGMKSGEQGAPQADAAGSTSGAAAAATSPEDYSDDHAQAAVRIQAAARGRIARKKVEVKRRNGESAPPEAAGGDANAEAAGETAGGSSEHHEKSAVRIQAAARGRIARKKVAALRESEAAAPAVQIGAVGDAPPPAKLLVQGDFLAPVRGGGGDPSDDKSLAELQRELMEAQWAAEDGDSPRVVVGGDDDDPESFGFNDPQPPQQPREKPGFLRHRVMGNVVLDGGAGPSSGRRPQPQELSAAYAAAAEELARLTTRKKEPPAGLTELERKAWEVRRDRHIRERRRQLEDQMRMEALRRELELEEANRRAMAEEQAQRRQQALEARRLQMAEAAMQRKERLAELQARNEAAQIRRQQEALAAQQAMGFFGLPAQGSGFHYPSGGGGSSGASPQPFFQTQTPPNPAAQQQHHLNVAAAARQQLQQMQAEAMRGRIGGAAAAPYDPPSDGRTPYEQPLDFNYKPYKPKRLYQRMERNFVEKVEIPELERRRAVLAQRRQQYVPIDGEQLRERERMIDYLIMTEEQQRRQREHASPNRAPPYERPLPAHSRFMPLVTEEERQRREKAAMEAERAVEKVVRSKQYAQLVKELFVPKVDETKRLELERRVWKPAAVAKDGFASDDSPAPSPYGVLHASPRRERVVASARPPALRGAGGGAGGSPARHRQAPADGARPASSGGVRWGADDPRGSAGLAEPPAITPEGGGGDGEGGDGVTPRTQRGPLQPSSSSKRQGPGSASPRTGPPRTGIRSLKPSPPPGHGMPGQKPSGGWGAPPQPRRQPNPPPADEAGGRSRLPPIPHFSRAQGGGGGNNDSGNVGGWVETTSRRPAGGGASAAFANKRNAVFTGPGGGRGGGSGGTDGGEGVDTDLADIRAKLLALSQSGY